MFSVKPLRSTGITLLLRYYGLLRPPLRPDHPLCIPTGLFLLAGLPGSSVVLSTHAVPFHPGEPDDCSLSFLRHQFWFRHIRQAVVELVETLTTLTGLTRPIRVRLRYGLHLFRTRVRPDGLLRLPLVLLRMLRVIHTVNPFQSTRTTRLVLAHRINECPRSVRHRDIIRGR